MITNSNKLKYERETLNLKQQEIKYFKIFKIYKS